MGAVTQSVERVTSGLQIVGSIPAPLRQGEMILAQALEKSKNGEGV